MRKKKIITSEVIFSAFGCEACKINENQHTSKNLQINVEHVINKYTSLNGQSCGMNDAIIFFINTLPIKTQDK